MGKPRRGSKAPDFTLPGTNGRDYRLSDYQGQPVVLAFYPGDDSAVCTLQLTSYSSDIDAFRDLDAVVFGISPQGIESHESFKSKRNLAFDLLADTEKTVGQLYGIVGPLGFYRRSVFVVDVNGLIAYAHRSITGAIFQPSKDLLAAIQSAR